jgi:RNA recognition motif-containing protein
MARLQNSKHTCKVNHRSNRTAFPLPAKAGSIHARENLMKLFVRNLSYKATDGDLLRLFDERGFHVSEAVVIMNSEDGRSRGFGFVTIVGDGSAAILDLHNSLHMGRTLHVEEAREKVKNGGSRGRRTRRGSMNIIDDYTWEDV